MTTNLSDLTSAQLDKIVKEKLTYQDPITKKVLKELETSIDKFNDRFDGLELKNGYGLLVLMHLLMQMSGEIKSMDVIECSELMENLQTFTNTVFLFQIKIEKDKENARLNA